jgi:phage shock protein A
MGLMQRFSTIVKAKASKILDRAEDPRETLDYSYEKQLEMLQKVRRGVADVATSKKRLELQSAKLEQSVVKLTNQAKTALGQGREDLARVALERKGGAQLQLQSLDEQREQLQAEQDKLISAEQRLTAKVEAFRTQKETIKAQYTAAEAQVKIGEAVTGVSEEMADVGLAIDRAHNKTETMRARAGAIDELIESGALTDLTDGRDDIDRQLAELEVSGGVDSELDALRKEIGTGAQSGGELLPALRGGFQGGQRRRRPHPGGRRRRRRGGLPRRPAPAGRRHPSLG